MIIAIDESNVGAAREFLRRAPESSLILLGNLAAHGPRLGEPMNSGNFRAVIEDGAVVAVFCLTRRGNLVLQTGGRQDLSREILTSCAEDSLPIRAVIGELRGADALWQELVKQPDFRPGNASKEVLYALDLDEARHSASSHEVRLAEPGDFERWDALMYDFSVEEDMPRQGTLEQRRRGFHEACYHGRFWAGLAAGQIVSTATVFALVDGMGQVGGVFTSPAHRRRGHSRAVLTALIRDCQARHGLSRLVLFTGQQSTAARAMYESLGFVAVGDFALYFARS